MSEINTNQNGNELDLNEFTMSVLVLGFVAMLILCLLLFTFNAITNGPKKDTKDNSEGFATDTDKILEIDLENHVEHDSAKLSQDGNAVIKSVIKPLQGFMIDVVVSKDRVPIDYWIFQEMAKNGSIDDKVVVYMTDLQDSTFSNQNARRLINEILTRGRCGTPNDNDNNREMCLYTIPQLCSDKRVLINWIFNHSWFTSARSKRYRMYNLYKKYFPLPLEADDYDAPLLEDATMYSTDNPVQVSKSNIQAENYLDVPETTKVMCSDQLFIEQDPDFSLYCNGEFLRWNGERSDSYQPVVARYYMVVVTDPDPVFSYTGDGLVIINEDTLPLENKNRFELENQKTVKKDINTTKTHRVESLSKLIKIDPLISWRRIKNRVDQKLSKLGELMVQEHRQESMVDGIQKLLDRSYIDMYQTFGIDIVIRNGEPYIFKIEASPAFKEYGSPLASDMLESLVDRTKLMLRL